MKTFQVADEQIGTRLDIFVVEQMPRLSRAFARKLCDQDAVLVNGSAQKAGYKVRVNDAINVNYDETALDEIPAIDLPIIYEDADCIVMNKPAGVLTHTQGSFSPEATVATFLRDYVRGMDGERGGIVHRLDRATSGVIIGAKNPESLSFLQKQFAQRKTKKTYIAIVEGRPKQKEAVIDMPIERNPKAPATFRVGANGKASITHYKVLAENDKYSLVELTPETGRTHQLRVHLAELGTPIVGDPLYGNGHFGDRLYLHAQSLEITVPSRERLTFKAPLPSEFKEFMHD